MSLGQRLRRSPLAQLWLARFRELYRDPSAIFWIYGFPILMVVALGIAFRSQPVETIRVDLVAQDGAAAIAELLRRGGGVPGLRFTVAVNPAELARRRLRTGKTDLVVALEPRVVGAPRYRFSYDETRPEGRLARSAVNDRLQVSSGRRDVAEVLPDHRSTEAGGRYIDFLVPGLLGMSLMSGGMWGVGYVIVDMRIRKLLRRFLATPMRRRHFLAAIMLSRLVFMIPEILVLLLFAHLAFGVAIYGSLLAIAGLILLGAFAFAGIGLLVASRARTIEAVSGLLNLVMMPMWILSGIFFSWERFPDALHPAIRALPLTALNDALRATMLEGAGPGALLAPVATLAAWGGVSFVLALRWFRWS
jgi:ABC-type multidrug transport system permease subunit